MPSGFFFPLSSDRSISSIWGIGLFFFCTMYNTNLEFHANSVNPTQTPHTVPSDTPHTAASYLGLHCVLMSHLWDAWLKWVKT